MKKRNKIGSASYTPIEDKRVEQLKSTLLENKKDYMMEIFSYEGTYTNQEKEVLKSQLETIDYVLGMIEKDEY